MRPRLSAEIRPEMVQDPVSVEFLSLFQEMWSQIFRTAPIGPKELFRTFTDFIVTKTQIILNLRFLCGLCELWLVILRRALQQS